MINSQIIFSMLGWFFSPLISIFINRVIDKRKDDKDRQRAFTEIAEKVEMLIINEIDIDIQLIKDMSHYISIKYGLKQPLKEQDILSRVSYEILSSIFVSKDVKSNILEELKQLNAEVSLKDNNQVTKVIFNEKVKEKRDTQRKTLVSILLAYFIVIVVFITLIPIMDGKMGFYQMASDKRLPAIVSIIGAFFAMLISLVSLLIYSSNDRKRHK